MSDRIGGDGVVGIGKRHGVMKPLQLNLYSGDGVVPVIERIRLNKKNTCNT